MQITLSRVNVLELLAKEEEEKNGEGKYVKNGKMKDVLVVYPYGQDIKFKGAGCLSITVDPLRIPEIRPFCGRVASIELDQEMTKSGSVFYRFINLKQIAVEPAAK